MIKNYLIPTGEGGEEAAEAEGGEEKKEVEETAEQEEEEGKFHSLTYE